VMPLPAGKTSGGTRRAVSRETEPAPDATDRSFPCRAAGRPIVPFTLDALFWHVRTPTGSVCGDAVQLAVGGIASGSLRGERKG
jgi:hypothetical protein